MINHIIPLITNKLIPLALALAGFGFLVALHEFGHFLMAKMFGIHTPTFSIGFGPKLIQRRWWNTDFRLSLIPLGGYVEIAGLAEVGQGDQAHAQDLSESSFETKPYWQKFLVMTGGIMFNMLFAYVTFTGLYFFGLPKEKAHIVVHRVIENSAAQTAGLQKDDVLVGINTTPFETKPEAVIAQMQEALLPAITNNPGTTIIFKVKRGTEEKELPVALGSKQEGEKTVGSLGASFSLATEMVPGEYERLPLMVAIAKGIDRTNAYVSQTASFVKSMFKKRTLEGAGGPIAILSTSFSMAQKGLLMLLIFMAIMSITLAVTNVIPLGFLDGGQLFMISLESLFRRKIPEKVKIGIALAFWGLFIVLALVLSYRDILALIR